MTGSDLPQSGPILQPKPRRQPPVFLAPLSTSQNSSANPSRQRTPVTTSPSPTSGNATQEPDEKDDSGPPHKSRSIINLTTSTLFGIYSPSSYENGREEPVTPHDGGSQTPFRNMSFDARRARLFSEGQVSKLHNYKKLQDAARSQPGGSSSGSSSSSEQGPQKRNRRMGHLVVGILWRAVILFSMGIGYGEFVTRLHDTGEVAPVQVQGIDRSSWPYLLFWGTSALVAGSLLPWLDGRRAGQREGEPQAARYAKDTTKGEPAGEGDGRSFKGADAAWNTLDADWTPIVRTIGAFVGIAFAIRRLPWQSTLQASLTLALVNPFIWYLIDRTKAGFALSSIVGLSGAAALLSINPNIVPPPVAPKLTETLFVSGVTSESISVATWISSVLFCSCVCFGNLGRLLNRIGMDM